VRIVIIALAAVLVLAGCSTPDEPSSDGLPVVTSTNTYADIVQQIGGDLVTVTALIDDPAQDPHSFEPSARDQLAISQAKFIVLNGGGYDPFMQDLMSASGTDALVLDAFDQVGSGDNEHIWYSVDDMAELSSAIAEALIAVDPDHVDQYIAGADAFAAALRPLQDRVHEQARSGDVLTTEPVPAYLLEGMGFTDVSPKAFTEAIEEGGDVPPAALDDVLQLLAGGTVVLLAYNSQTASSETERVRQAAEDAGVPVVDFTELMPQGDTYVSWMTANIDAIQAALDE
jgi:zinc/manganese transport system substrate-binding protein